MRRKINIIFYIFMAVYNINIYSQSSVHYINPSTPDKHFQNRDYTYIFNLVNIPQSPEVASMMRKGKYSAPLSHGLPDISIPIYTIQSGSLSFPISLSYYAGGIKIDDQASWVGLGWTLNAGGVIAKTVMDRPDPPMSDIKHTAEEINRLGSNSGYLDLFWKMITYNKKNYAGLDQQRDKYDYCFNGNNGTFYFDGKTGDIVQIPYTVNKITREVNSQVIINPNKFEIVIPDGTIYKFEATERSRVIGVNRAKNMFNELITSASMEEYQCNTTWHLTEIISADKKSTISFTYESSDTSYDDYVFSSSYVEKTITGDKWLGIDLKETNRNYYSDNVTTKTTYETKILKEIKFNEGKVVFNHIKDRTDGRKHRLTEIEVIPYNGTTVKKIKFDNSSYFSGPRLKLNSVSFLGSDAKVYDKYMFSYFDGNMPPPYKANPPINSGTYHSYFSQDLLGYYNNATNKSLVYNVINRPMPELANRTYNFNAAKTYTLNKISYITGGETEFIYDAYPGNIPRSPALRIKEIISRNTNMNNNNKEHKIYRYGNDVTTGSNFVNFENNFIDYNYNESVSGFPNVVQGYFPIYTMDEAKKKPIVELIYLHADMSTFYPYAEMFKEYTSNPRMFNAEQVMYYQYGTIEELCVSENRTDTLKTVYTFENEKPIFHTIPLFTPSSSCNPPNSFFPSFYSVYKTYRQGSLLQSFPIRTDWTSGLLKRKDIYRYNKGIYRLQESITNEYEKFKNNKVYTGLHLRGLLFTKSNPYWEVSPRAAGLTPNYYYNTELYLDCKTLDNYFYHDIFEFTGWKKLVKTVSSRYEENLPRIPITKTELYKYESINKTTDSHPFVTKQTEELKTGEIQEHRFKYPVDFKSIDIYKKMIDNNFINAVINKESEFKKESSINSKITEKVDFDINLFPYKSTRTFTRTQGTNTIATDSAQIAILSRTTTGMPLETLDNTGLYCVYVWETNNLIAEIKNARLSEISNKLNNNVQYQQFIGGMGMSQESLGLLRTNLLNAHITSYTYKPLVGITSVKDPAGIVTHYEYDGAGRLKKTFIEDANGVKKGVNLYDYRYKNE
ncbi:RHS repeat domain-containing protein [uncultured Dysgonomonas sp.]|uniref:YD repeat-containing protein n=1 Tax=uncultured Dysgonomonas sp. TaxID=206096 RepID=A0A212JNV9_9BACT|nr:RHS repeat domain-containing protein [uncultured Dysgonomonas sp.]SBW01080.1 hypothetical protein KL86DYS1_20363 [uncultured Dysgonomonas sp.]